MDFTLDEKLLSEFRHEALGLFVQAESALQSVRDPSSFSHGYQTLFRALHSAKAGAGMFEMESLQKALHQLETALTQQSGETVLSANFIEYLREGLSKARLLLD